MSVMSMWTNVFGSMGKRTTGTGPGNFLIVGPNWQGATPPDIRAPSGLQRGMRGSSGKRRRTDLRILRR